jgi:outer membrane protein assembly factor BamB
MRKYFMRACVAVAASVPLVAMGVTGASAAPTAAGSVRASGAGVSRTAAAPGAQLWAKRYSDGGVDLANSAAVSSDGKTVFVTGTGKLGYATVAYNTSTGAQQWVKHYNGNNGGAASSVAVSPTGGTVFVTGWTDNTGLVSYATVAYNTATGAQQWAKHYSGPSGYSDQARSVTVSPDGKTVFVTGDSKGNYGTVAYNAATGAQLWAKRYTAIFGSTAYSLGVSPSGTTVFVTGEGWDLHSGFDYATVAYNAATGAQQSAKRYNGPNGSDDSAYSLAVSPSGTTVFVTGASNGRSSRDFATVAYNAATGAQQWVARYNAPANGIDSAESLAVSPTGSTVYVTGPSSGSGTAGYQYATVAYNAATGAQQWASRYTGGYWSTAVAVSPANGTVFVTGYTNAPSAYATVAYHG